jgi:hypothetical protein
MLFLQIREADMDMRMRYESGDRRPSAKDKPVHMEKYYKKRMGDDLDSSILQRHMEGLNIEE